MKQLLLDIEDVLASGVGFKHAFITPAISEEYVSFPRDLKLPAAGIAFAGEEEADDGSAGSLTRTQDVLVGVFAPTGSTNPRKGALAALELAEAVKAKLHRNLLGRDYISLAHYQGAGPTTLVDFPSKGLATQIILKFRYELEE